MRNDATTPLWAVTCGGRAAVGVVSASAGASLVHAHRVGYPVLTGVTSVGLIVAAVGGFTLLAAAALGVALVNEFIGGYTKPPVRSLLERARLTQPIRALLRSLLVAVAIGVAAGEESTPLILYGTAAACAHVLAIVCSTLLGWVLGRPPAFGVRNLATDVKLSRAFEDARRMRPAAHSAMLANEWLIVVGLAIA
jgi:hypothetical protein